MFFGVSGTVSDEYDSNLILSNDTRQNLDLDLDSGVEI